MPPAEWAAAWTLCVSSRSHALVEQQDALLVYVDTRHTFHPLHAVLALDAFSSSSSDADADVAPREPPVPSVMILVLRLHPEIGKLVRVLKPSHADLADEILADIIFGKRIEDPATDPSGATGSPVLRAMPSLFARQVHLTSGVLRTYAQDAAEANGLLRELTMAIQSQRERIREASEDLDQFMLLVEHETGYVGQVMNTQQSFITSVVDVRMKEIQTLERNAMSLDNLLEEYEADYRDYMDMTGEQSQPDTIEVCVRAGFKLWSGASSHDFSERVRAYLLSSWSGIENVRELFGNPPPQAMSELCFEIIRQDAPSFASSSSLADAETLDTFPQYLSQSIQLLQNLQNAVNEPQKPWKPMHLHLPADSSAPLKQFRKFFDDQHAGFRDSDDSTIDMSMTLTIDRDGHQAKPPSDVDFCEQLWDFCVVYAQSADVSISIVREFLVSFLKTRTFPFVDPTNPTKLATFLKERMDIFRNSSAADLAHGLDHVQQDLVQPHNALAALIELGQWKVHRDVALWFSRVGFTITESTLLADELRRLDTITQCINPWQQIVDICALGYSIGLSSSQLRVLVSNCMPHVKHQNSDTTSVPGFVLSLNFYLPERLRSYIAEPILWDIVMSLCDLHERRIRICDCSFHSTCRAVPAEDEQFMPGSVGKLIVKALRCGLPDEMLADRVVSSLISQVENANSVLPNLASSPLIQIECTTRMINF